MWRHSFCKQKGTKGPEGMPLLDAASLDYLFAQVEFLKKKETEKKAAN